MIGKSSGGGDFKPHPAGSHVMVCVDVVDLGEKVESFQGKDPRIVHECALVFAGEERDDRGQRAIVTAYYKLSLHEKAKLRQHLEPWRGKPFSEREAREGFDLSVLENQPALVMLSHKQSAKGRTYAVVDAIGQLPRGVVPPIVDDYQRPDWFAERKKANAADVARFREHEGSVEEAPF